MNVRPWPPLRAGRGPGRGDGPSRGPRCGTARPARRLGVGAPALPRPPGADARDGAARRHRLLPAGDRPAGRPSRRGPGGLRAGALLVPQRAGATGRPALGLAARGRPRPRPAGCEQCQPGRSPGRLGALRGRARLAGCGLSPPRPGDGPRRAAALRAAAAGADAAAARGGRLRQRHPRGGGGGRNPLRRAGRAGARGARPALGRAARGGPLPAAPCALWPLASAGGLAGTGPRLRPARLGEGLAAALHRRRGDGGAAPVLGGAGAGAPGGRRARLLARGRPRARARLGRSRHSRTVPARAASSPRRPWRAPPRTGIRC